MKRLPFHIQQNLTAERLWVILCCGFDGTVDAAHIAEKCDLAVSVLEKVVLPFVRQLGLIRNTDFSLTDLGEQFYQLGKHSLILLPEAMHHLLYTLHHNDKGKHFSWAYAKVVDALWLSGERNLDGETMAQLVGMVVDEAVQTFNIPAEQIAFSRDSIRGVLNWLRALDPPVVTNEGKANKFRRRYFCPIPAFFWGLDFLYRINKIAYGVRMFLTSECIEQLCKVCVLDPSGLENVLMMAKRISDYERGGVFDYGTEGGFGRWLLLASPCPLPKLPEGVKP
ncbi:MAG: hypothetical protein NZ805_15630 [Armatimonadetes bacterium]|nr:hypothetical protein [Armatimonadota bacterium]MDW8029828.1 hypothetical protein [Armatimonadota bacterium]